MHRPARETTAAAPSSGPALQERVTITLKSLPVCGRIRSAAQVSSSCSCASCGEHTAPETPLIVAAGRVPTGSAASRSENPCPGPPAPVESSVADRSVPDPQTLLHLAQFQSSPIPLQRFLLQFVGRRARSRRHRRIQPRPAGTTSPIRAAGFRTAARRASECPSVRPHIA